jgi:DNA-binding SARP family transcriptional activator
MRCRLDIFVKFMGNPELYVEENKIYVQQDKLKAVLFYLMFNVSCTRDELIYKFWPDYSESNAKRNLRNAIYKLKKILSEHDLNDMILTKGNSYVEINNNYCFIKDIEMITKERNEADLLNLNEFIFLENLSLSNSIGFDEWLRNIRVVFEDLLIEKLERGFEQSKSQSNVKLMECFAKKIIVVDQYNESGYENIIRIYLNDGQYNKAIKYYKTLENILKLELGIEPNEQLVRLYEEVIQLKNAYDKTKNTYVGKTNLLRLSGIQNEFNKFMKDEEYKHCIVIGDIGVDKISLLNDFIGLNKNVDVIEIESTQNTQKIQLYAANKLLLKLNELLDEEVDLKECTVLCYYNEIEKRIRNINKTVIYLKNVHFFDLKSFSIFESLFFESSDSVFLIGNYTASLSDDYKEYNTISRCRAIKQIEIELLVNDSERNNVKISNEVEDLLQTLDRVKEKVFKTISFFPNGTTLEILEELLELKRFELYDILEEFKNKNIIEVSDYLDHSVFKFKNDEFRVCIYRTIMKNIRASIHDSICEVLKNHYISYMNDYYYISELYFHYGKTDMQYKRLLYSLKYLEYILDYYDELFPKIKKVNHIPVSFFLSGDKINEIFSECLELVNSVSMYVEEDKLNEMWMLYYFLNGRNQIRTGDKNLGITYIHKSLKIAKDSNNENYLMKNYREMIYFGVKSENVNLMKEYIEKSKKIERFCNNTVEKGILLRVEAIYNIYNNSYEIAEKFLYKSIDIFRTPKFNSAYFLNLAAAHYFLGSVYMDKNQFDKAEKNYDKAINICLENKINKGLDMFYLEKGYLFFIKRDYNEAVEYFNKSFKMYDKLGTYWKRSVGESCMSIIHIRKGDKEKAREHYQKALIFSRNDSTKIELSMLNEARELINRN